MFGRQSRRDRDLGILDGSQRATTPKQRARGRAKAAKDASDAEQRFLRKDRARFR
ncbi:hypothetical protein [Streptomyces sp. B15]|uniref:hypothetical protein n=1 Tax=Streptomyces sp. B15 TaxID=1537797 RepID=UPI001B37E806|nr:hypothetical protein [Streptomyces sp. B15]MBQ1122619.1 hypothetical protein [Streptomyces sp. B15]